MGEAQARRITLGSGNGARRAFEQIAPAAAMPNLNAIQRDSFDWFLKEGLKELFAEMSPMDSAPRTTEV